MKKDSKHSINCDACNCVHNDGNCCCTKDNIEVGTQNACCCDDTRCASFKMKNDDKGFFSPLE